MGHKRPFFALQTAASFFAAGSPFAEVTDMRFGARTLRSGLSFKDYRLVVLTEPDCRSAPDVR
jgi:hypothetical protein